jgi:hypothetical protein
MYLRNGLLKLEGFVDWRMDLGGEMIHGKNTLLDKIAQEQGWDKRQVFFSFPPGTEEELKADTKLKTEWFWIGRDATLLPYKTEDPDVRKMIKVFRQMFEGKDISPNVTVYEYLVANGVPQRVIGIADALWGKVYGSQLDLVGVNEARNEEHNTIAEEGFEYNYRVRTSFYDLVKYLKAPLDIRTNFQVKSVTTNSDGTISVANAKGDSVSAKRVIIAVPLPILQDGDIKFTPALPKEKTEALSHMGMEPATKVILKFSQRFWPDNVELVICGDSFVPEIWADGGSYRGPNAPHTIVGFCVGDAARNIGKMDDKTVVRLFQAQLNQMFGNNQDLTPASRYCLGSTIFRWADQPFVRGGYSYPKLGSLGDRERLAKPVNNQIFFAGEATSYTCESGTINAAMVTGKRAADLALASFLPKAKL